MPGSSNFNSSVDEGPGSSRVSVTVSGRGGVVSPDPRSATVAHLPARAVPFKLIMRLKLRAQE